MVNADKPEKLDKLPRMGTDEVYRYIEKAAGIETPNDQFRQKIARCIRSAHWETDYADVRARKFLNTVGKLRAHAEALLRDLTCPNYGGDDKNKKAEALTYAYALDWLGVSDVLVQDLRDLIEQADLTLGAAPPEKGRPVNVRFRTLIACLTDLYEEFKGLELGLKHGQYQLPHFPFVEACLERLVPPPIPSNETLRMALKRHLKRRGNSG